MNPPLDFLARIPSPWRLWRRFLASRWGTIEPLDVPPYRCDGVWVEGARGGSVLVPVKPFNEP